MKIYLKRVFFPFLLIAVGIFFIQCNNTDTSLKQMATELNKLLPRQVDDIAVLDSVKVLQNNSILYSFTLDTSDTPETSMPLFELYFYKQSLRNIQESTDPNIKKLVELNTIISQNYYDKKGKLILQLTITPDEYNKKPDMKSDEYVHGEINKVVEALAPQLPMTDNQEVFTEIKALYPRTVVYHIQKNDLVKPTSFDSIQFKQKEKIIITKDLKYNIFGELLKGASLSYKYIFTDKNQTYIATLDISPEDYK